LKGPPRERFWEFDGEGARGRLYAIVRGLTSRKVCWNDVGSGLVQIAVWLLHAVVLLE
jgi:hypothetical protein